MLRIRRTFVSDELGFRVDTHLGLALDHRAVAIGISPGSIVDGRLMPREPSPERTYLYLMLEGAVELHGSRRSVSAPAWLLAESRGAFHGSEQTRVRGPHVALAFQLDRAIADHRGPLRSGGCAADLLRAGADLHGALGRSTAFEELAGAEARLFAALKAGPLPEIGPPTLDAPSERHVRFAEALSRALSKVDERPAQIDLAEGGESSERTARRLFAEIAERYGWAYDRWQTLRRQWSTTLACLLLVMPGARPRDVARRVGFASVTGLHHALERAGMPPPRELQALAARLEVEATALDLAGAMAKTGQSTESSPAGSERRLK